MKKLIVLLASIGILSTACAKNENIVRKESDELDISVELLDGAFSSKSNDHIAYTYKCEYLKDLDDLEDDIVTSDSLYEEESTLKMIDIQEEKFQIWNDELNNIYRVLKNQLSGEEYEEFKSKEITWLNKREALAEEDASNFEGMDFAQVQYNSSLAKLTKERCYELVNTYLQ